MKKIFSKYLSLGSYSAFVPPLDDESVTSTESHKTAPQETAASAGPSPTAAGPRGKNHDATPSKDVLLQPPSSPQPPQDDEVSCSNRVPIAPYVPQEAAWSKRIFGIPVPWSPTPSVDTQQRIASEMESAPSTVPLGQYSETKADSLASRLRPVYKRDSRTRGARSRFWQRYGVLVVPGVVCLTVLLVLVLLSVLKRRPGAHPLGAVDWGLDHGATKGVLNASEA